MEVTAGAVEKSVRRWKINGKKIEEKRGKWGIENQSRFSAITCED